MIYTHWISKPRNMFLVLLFIIFALEIFVMHFALLFYPGKSASIWLITCIDAALLTLFSAPLIWLSIINPVTRFQSNTNKELQKSLLANKINAEVMKATGIGILITDEKNKILSVNPGFTRLTGISEKEAIGKTPAILHSGRHGKEFYQTMWQSIQDTGSWEGELYNKKIDGNVYLESLHITQVKSAKGKVTNYIGVFQDITADKAYKDQLIDKARFDALTGIYNRLAFTDHINQLLAQAKRDNKKIVVLFVDLDKFKKINDSYGHETGDKLLKHTANTLKENLRATDIISRFGGDEFVIASTIENTENSQDNALILVKKIIHLLSQPTEINSQTFTIQLSIGISIAPDNASDIDELIRMADKAMYLAKLENTSSYVFWSN